jgi:hypothetical protein
MRTTLRIDDALLREAKKVAAAEGKTVAAVIEDALRETLLRRRAGGRRRPATKPLPVFKGRGLLPGIDLDDTSSLLDRLDRDS